MEPLEAQGNLSLLSKRGSGGLGDAMRKGCSDSGQALDIPGMSTCQADKSPSHFLAEKEAETLKRPAHGPTVPCAAMSNLLGQTNTCKLREVLLSSLLLGKAFVHF